MEKIDRYFKISARGGSLKTEILAGFTTFVAMSYVLAVNPMILSTTGMDKAALLTVTALSAMAASLFMGFFANMPVALAPAMGTNAYFAFIVCASMGLTWQEALSATFYNGIFFLAISISGFREKIIKSVPLPLQVGLQCGIGLFIAFLGLRNAGIVVPNDATIISMGNIASHKPLLAILGFAATAFLMARKVRGAIIYIIALLTVLGFFICDDSGAALASAPSKLIDFPAPISQTFFALDFGYPFRNISESLPIIATLLVLDMFDTIGTIIALGRRAGFMDSKGNLRGFGRVLLVDSSATIFGALLGTSTVTCYAESAAGVEAGGKTGVTAIIVGILFGLALFISPIITSVPDFATSPALIMVGIMMMCGISALDFGDIADFVPALFCMIMILLSFSITTGFSFGVVMYIIMMVSTKRARKIKVGTWLLFALMLAFIVGTSLK